MQWGEEKPSRLARISKHIVDLTAALILKRGKGETINSKEVCFAGKSLLYNAAIVFKVCVCVSVVCVCVCASAALLWRKQRAGLLS